MTHAPVTAVWEVTMGCNMQCQHCGSSCAAPLPDELDTDEALRLCDEIGALGLKWVTLSGGEPFLRRDWHRLARRLRDHGVIPNVISNGWLIDGELLGLARDAGVGSLAISLDGIEQTHDSIRKRGSYRRVVRALRSMAEQGIAGGAITTIHAANIGQLLALTARENAADDAVAAGLVVRPPVARRCAQARQRLGAVEALPSTASGRSISRHGRRKREWPW